MRSFVDTISVHDDEARKLSKAEQLSAMAMRPLGPPAGMHVTLYYRHVEITGPKKFPSAFFVAKKEKKKSDQEASHCANMAAAADAAGLPNISTLLETITNSLSGSGSSLPEATKDAPTDVSIEPPQDGISLLDSKNELLLTYLHNLVFLAIFQLRNLSTSEEDADKKQSQQEEVVQKLNELRVYLERGVRPLEGRLKYQVDKVIKAAGDDERDAGGIKAAAKSKTKKTPKAKSGNEEAASDEDDEDSDSDEDEDEDEDEDIDEMAYRPNVSAFSKGVQSQAKPAQSAQTAPSDGIYRPPKIMPTALPTTESRERKDRGPRRSNIIDEFVNAEMSSAPTAEASIGSTIRSGGRHVRSQKEKDEDNERRAYEETNFVRLPKVSKKEKAKQRGSRGQQGTYGGEDWQGLTEGADRIARLTQKSRGSGSALDRSRKRKTDETSGGGNVGMGQSFDKRRKKVESWKR